MSTLTRVAVVVAITLAMFGTVLAPSPFDLIVVLLTLLGVLIALLPKGSRDPDERPEQVDDDRLRSLVPLLELAPLLVKGGKERFAHDPERLRAAARIIEAVSTSVGELHPSTRREVSEMQWRQLRARSEEPPRRRSDVDRTYQILREDLPRLLETIEAFLREGR